MGIDRVTERAARWLAARTTRRSFLANSARVAMVGVGGVGLAAVFEQQASARVCGQSGVSPMCPTFDCSGPDVVWGWCWYASPGCCSNGGLKKICDCCGVGYKNVQGYCPPGSAVYCVVESCLEDPRVQKVALDRYAAASTVDANIAFLVQRPNGSSPVVVVVTADPLLMAIAAPVAAELGATLVLADGTNVRPASLDQLRRLGSRNIVIVGPLSGASVASLQELGTVETLTAANDLASQSIDVAVWMSKRTGRNEAVCIGAGGPAQNLAPLAGAYAAARRRPVLVTPDAVGAFQAVLGSQGAVLLIGKEVAPGFTRFPGGLAIDTDDIELASLTVANRLLQSSEEKYSARFCANDGTSLVAAVQTLGPIIAVGQGERTVLRDWIIEHRARFGDAVLVRNANGPADDALVYQLQSALNGFDSHLLVGQDGNGIPVYPQPPEERRIGAARVRGELPPTSNPPTTARKRTSPTTAPVGVSPPATPAPKRIDGTAPAATLFIPKSSQPTIATRPNRAPSVLAPVTVATTSASTTTTTTATPTTTTIQPSSSTDTVTTSSAVASSRSRIRDFEA
jgi:hypothetical protein